MKVPNLQKSVDALAKEFDENVKKIQALTLRNVKIRQTLRAVNEVVSGIAHGVKKRRSPAKPEDGESFNAKVLKAYTDGGVKWVRDVAIQAYGRVPTQDEVDRVSNTSQHLMKAGKLIRVRRGHYRLKFYRGTPKDDRTKADIGADTHIKQIQPPPPGN